MNIPAKKKLKITGLVLIFIVSLFLILLPAITGDPAIDYLRDFGISMLSAILMTVLYQFFLIDDPSILTDEIETMQALTKRGIKKVELASIPKSYTSQVLAAKEIKICFNTAYTIIKQLDETLVHALNNGCTVKVLLSNPDYRIFTGAEEEFSHIRSALCKNTDIPTEINSTVKFLREISQRAQKRKGTLTAAYANCFITGSCIIIDGKHCDYTPYLPYNHSKNSLRLEFENTDPEVFSRFTEFFDAAWKEGSELSL